MAQEIQQDTRAANLAPALLPAIINTIEAFVRSLGFLDAGISLAQVLGPVLAAGISPEEAVGWTEDFYRDLKANGFTPYAFTAYHDDGQTLSRKLFARAAGMDYGNLGEETPAMRANQIRGLQATLAAKEAALLDATHPENWDPDGLVNFRRQILNLATKPLGRPA